LRRRAQPPLTHHCARIGFAQIAPHAYAHTRILHALRARAFSGALALLFLTVLRAALACSRDAIACNWTFLNTVAPGSRALRFVIV